MLCFILNYFITLEKCKFFIFSRRRYLNHPNVYLDDNVIPFVPNVIYLGITLDPKRRWLIQIILLTVFTSRWANFLRFVSSIWWISHPSSLLYIYISIICSKLDYECFLYGPAFYFNLKKVNKIQISCLRNIMGYVWSTPCPAIKVEVICPPFNIRCWWLAGKFILKSFQSSHF